MKIFVTGGAGFIGSNLVDRLLAEGHEVDVADDLSSGSLANLADARLSGRGRMSFNQLDVRTVDLIDLMKRCQPEVVYHLAARPDGPASLDDPLTDADINVLGSLRVLEGCRLSGVAKVVFASSADHVYGEAEPSDLPLKESHPQRPATPHGVAKKAVVDYLHAYRDLHSLEFTALVFSSVYGPRQDPGRGAGVVASFAHKLLTGAACTVFGDGSQTRDFVFVDDAVDALARAASRGGGLSINIGTGVETKIGDLYRVMADQIGVDQPTVRAPERPGDRRRAALDPGRAAIHLGWRPWTALPEGTAAVIEWFRSTLPDPD